MAECRFCKNERKPKAKVCAKCGRNQFWGSLGWANAALALLVAVLSVATLAWDRLKPVFWPDRADIMVELAREAREGHMRVYLTNLSKTLVSTPRFAWCTAIGDRHFDEMFQVYRPDNRQYAALNLGQTEPRSLALGDVTFNLQINWDIFPEPDVATGLKGDFDCTIQFRDQHSADFGAVETLKFRMAFQYVRNIVIVAVGDQPDEKEERFPLDPMLFSARADVFGCGDVDPDPVKPAC